MKESYNFINNNNIEVIDKDINGNIKKQIYEYSNNINEILVKENILEELSIQKENACKDIEEIKSYLFKEQGFICKLSNCLCLAIVMFITFCFSPAMSLLKYFISIGCFIIPTLILDINLILERKKYWNQIKGLNLKLKEIANLRNITEDELNNLKKQTKTKNNYKKETTTKINYINTLKNIRNNLYLYYFIGNNYNKIIEYYESNKLEKKLKKYYTEDEISIITNYLEKNGPILSKRKN